MVPVIQANQRAASIASNAMARPVSPCAIGINQPRIILRCGNGASGGNGGSSEGGKGGDGGAINVTSFEGLSVGPQVVTNGFTAFSFPVSITGTQVFSAGGAGGLGGAGGAGGAVGALSANSAQPPGTGGAGAGRCDCGTGRLVQPPESFLENVYALTDA